MAELLSHVLIAFCLFTVVGWWVDWLDRKWVAVGMVGAIFPDLNRIGMVLDAGSVEAVLGIPFGWGGLHTIGGVLVLAGIGAILFPTRQAQLRAFGLLVAGGASHLVTDAVKAWADGYNGAYLYPFSWWRNPTPGWYVSADRWVIVLVLVVTIAVLGVDRYLIRNREDGGELS